MIGDFAGDSLTIATILMVWIPGIASGIVANIPFTVAALPIADYLWEPTWVATQPTSDRLQTSWL